MGDASVSWQPSKKYWQIHITHPRQIGLSNLHSTESMCIDADRTYSGHQYTWTTGELLYQLDQSLPLNTHYQANDETNWNYRTMISKTFRGFASRCVYLLCWGLFGVTIFIVTVWMLLCVTPIVHAARRSVKSGSSHIPTVELQMSVGLSIRWLTHLPKKLSTLWQEWRV